MRQFFSLLRKIGTFFLSLLGILGVLLKTLLQVMTVGLICAAIVGVILYIKVKPEVDYCMSLAYDKLAQMQRSDFSLLSDTEIFDKDGTRIGLINAGHYEYVDISHISINIQNAYIAQEDRRFKSHNGVDYIATARAGLALFKHSGGITQGGSTITQQVVKNTYLSREQTFTRKLVEILLAPEVEKAYTKADIMEFYCNTNFYGNQCYGVQAASRYYFGKDARDLEIYEAAVLVGVSNSPSAYDPVRHPEASLEKRNEVLKSMYTVSMITKEEYEGFKEKPLSIVQEESEGTEENYQSSYAIHCAALELMKKDGFEFQYIFEDKASYEAYFNRFDAVYSEKSGNIRAGGYKIYTALDSNLQNVMQDNLDQTLAKYTEIQDNGKFALQGAGVIVDNRTNYVVAVVGGRGRDDAFNRAYLSARQPGSTIKPLIDYAPAFDSGEYYPTRIVNDHLWEDGPANSSRRYYGNITCREALNRSLNTVAWQVLQDIGIRYGLDYLGKMQFQKITYIDNSVQSLSIGGFTNGLRVVDMAKGYSTLSNGGTYSDRTCIVQVTHEHEGDLLKDITPQSHQVYLEDTAFMITDIMKGTMTESYGTGRGLGVTNMPSAGKTGTTNSNKDTWFCGYTKYYTSSVWVGYDTPRSMPGIYGSTFAGKIWKNTMNQIHEGLEPLDWTAPDTLITSSYNRSTGKRHGELPEDIAQAADGSTEPRAFVPRAPGSTDYFSITAEVRAQQSVAQKSQQRLTDDLARGTLEFEAKEINTVEDTYNVQAEYAALMNIANQLEDGDIRKEYHDRITYKNDKLEEKIASMADEIKKYEQRKINDAVKARERAEKKAAEDARGNADETRRRQEEAQNPPPQENTPPPQTEPPAPPTEAPTQAPGPGGGNNSPAETAPEVGPGVTGGVN